MVLVTKCAIALGACGGGVTDSGKRRRRRRQLARRDLFSPHSQGNITHLRGDRQAVRPHHFDRRTTRAWTCSRLKQKKSIAGGIGELMFTRSMFETPRHDRAAAPAGLTANLVDDGTLRTTVTKTIEGFTAANLREAHRDVQTGRMTGKVVVTR